MVKLVRIGIIMEVLLLASQLVMPIGRASGCHFSKSAPIWTRSITPEWCLKECNWKEFYGDV
jgi:hypothetical protein